MASVENSGDVHSADSLSATNMPMWSKRNPIFCNVRIVSFVTRGETSIAFCPWFDALINVLTVWTASPHEVGTRWPSRRTMGRRMRGRGSTQVS